jgi:phosphatidate cytidylyltransferase
MHLKRWLTGIIALPILIFLIGSQHRWPLYILLYAASVAALIEFYRMTEPELPKFVRWSSYLLTLSLFAAVYLRQILLLPVVTALWAFVPMTFYMLTPPKPSQQWTWDIGKTVFGPIYVGIPLSMLLHIDRFYPRGNLWIFYLLTVIFASDTGAFYFGKFFGRHKLHQKISPGKTWEGAIGGLLSSIFVAFVFLRVIPINRVESIMLLLAASLCIAGQVGDLAESMLKRNHGVKDTGCILPGHGGLLDRIDGLLFSIPILYIYLSFSVS